MVLPTHQVDRFYQMWRPLLTFTNDALKVVPSLSGAGAKDSIDVSKAVEVRNALWENEAILDRFIEENPAQLPSEDLDILKTWKYHLQGDFILFKVLKKHSIFISHDKTSDVFAVKGLYSSFDEIFGPYLPILIKTVLLPFNDEIIADGLFQSYNLTFGSGYRSQFKSKYDDAKELGAIITTLLPDRETPSRESQLSKAGMINARVLDAFQKYEYQAGLSPKTVERDQQAAMAYAQFQLSQQAEPVSLRELSSDREWNYLLTLQEKERKSARLGLKRFIIFLRDTERLDWEKAEGLLERLKQP